MMKHQLLAQMSLACDQENAEKIIHLVTRRGVDVHRKDIGGSTWLMIACCARKYKTVETLLELGADPHRIETIIIDGKQVSMNAFDFDNIQIKRLLKKWAAKKEDRR